MTDWVRVAAYTVLGVLLLLVVAAGGWVVESRRKLRRYRLTEAQRHERAEDIRKSRIRWN